MTGQILLATTLTLTLGFSICSAQNAKTSSDRGKELCQEAKYTAAQKGKIVTITAKGEHNTGGYRVAFEQAAITVFPPEFSFYHWRPTGIVAEVITPFTATTNFSSKKKVKSVKVTDGNGPHEIQMAQH
jgi:hypothetical protein